MTQLTDKIWAVEVPNDASPYILDSANNKGQGLFWTQPGVQSPPWKDLPPGTWRFLFTTKTATEEDARKVVAAHGKHFRDYVRKFYKMPLTVFTALESLSSLLRSKGLDDKNYALIEKITNNEAH